MRSHSMRRGGAWWRVAPFALVITLLSACSVQSNLTNIFGQRTPSPLTVVANDHPALGGRVSQNWAGYEAILPNVTTITATWQMPRVAGSVESDSSTWIGIGGDRSATLIQAGTDQLIQKGKPLYYAWIELLPAGPQVLREITPLPGDTVTFTIAQVGADSWRIDAVDKDANQKTSRTIAYHSCLCSAEWIEEAPNANGVETTLANFGSVTFTNCVATWRDATASFVQAHARPIRMGDNRGATLAQPQQPIGDGFSIVYTGS